MNYFTIFRFFPPPPWRCRSICQLQWKMYKSCSPSWYCHVGIWLSARPYSQDKWSALSQTSPLCLWQIIRIQDVASVPGAPVTNGSHIISSRSGHADARLSDERDSAERLFLSAHLWSVARDISPPPNWLEKHFSAHLKWRCSTWQSTPPPPPLSRLLQRSLQLVIKG